MKKLMLSVAMFMFICGGSTVAMAQDPVKKDKAPTEQTEKSEEKEKAKEESTKADDKKSDDTKAEEPATEAAESKDTSDASAK